VKSAKRHISETGDRIDLRFRPFARCQDPFIETVEPAHLQQLVTRHIEQKCRDTDAEQLGEYNYENGADEIFVSKQP
jgi:hypothetical protein